MNEGVLPSRPHWSGEGWLAIEVAVEHRRLWCSDVRRGIDDAPLGKDLHLMEAGPQAVPQHVGV